MGKYLKNYSYIIHIKIYNNKRRNPGFIRKHIFDFSSYFYCLHNRRGLFLTDFAIEREFQINNYNVSKLDTLQIIERIVKAEKLEDDSQLCVNASIFSCFFQDTSEIAGDLNRHN